MAARAASAAAAASSADDAWLETLLREAPFPEAHPRRAKAKREAPMITGIILDI
jgi:hypothetical protein